MKVAIRALVPPKREAILVASAKGVKKEILYYLL